MKWVLGVLVGTLGLGLAACGSGSGGSKPAAQAGGVNSPPAATAGMVSVAQNPAQGSILVDSQGRTLYLFEHDNGTKSACTGACASVWPALTAAATPGAGAGVDASSLATADGQVPNQVTYHGHLLYHYSGDAAPGDVKGVGIPGWYPVSPSGAKVDKDDKGSGSSGYGY
jgi:predicted lipoprotein with Yx(FWY)xxD motif